MVIQAKVPYLAELQSSVDDAHSVLDHSLPTDAVYRLPIGYPGFLAPFLSHFPEAVAVKILNLLFFSTLVATLCLFRSRQVGHPAAHRYVVLLLLAVSLHPYLILNISRASEAVMAAALLTVFTACVIRPPSIYGLIGAGTSLGCLVHVRPNALTLFLPVALWLWSSNHQRSPVWHTARALGSVSLIATMTYSCLSLAWTGVPFYTPTNGPYNLFAGTNEYTLAYLDQQQNAEHSIGPALQARQIAYSSTHSVPGEVYSQLARDYVREHVQEVPKLLAAKLAVYFSPRLNNADGILETVIQWLCAVPATLGATFSAWLGLVRKRHEDRMIAWVFISYTLPFVLTNADPRLRFPLDVVAVVYLFELAFDRLECRSCAHDGSSGT